MAEGKQRGLPLQCFCSGIKNPVDPVNLRPPFHRVLCVGRRYTQIFRILECLNTRHHLHQLFSRGRPLCRPCANPARRLAEFSRFDKKDNPARMKRTCSFHEHRISTKKAVLITVNTMRGCFGISLLLKICRRSGGGCINRPMAGSGKKAVKSCGRTLV